MNGSSSFLVSKRVFPEALMDLILLISKFRFFLLAIFASSIQVLALKNSKNVYLLKTLSVFLVFGAYFYQPYAFAYAMQTQMKAMG